MSNNVIIGLDLGTSRCKAVAINTDRAVLATTSAHIDTTVTPQGHAEQDTIAIWRTAASVLRNLMDRLGPSHVAAIGLSGAMHTIVPIDANHQPLAPATIWQDQRALQLLEALRPRINADRLYHATGCPLLHHYHAPRLRWMREHMPDTFNQAERFVGIKEFALFQLTGQWAMDLASASSTGLLNIHHFNWDQSAVELATITPSRLPVIVLPNAVIGRITRQAAEETGLPAQTLVVAGSSDGALANVGIGAAPPHRTAISTGTSAAVRTSLNEPHYDRQARSWCYVLTAHRWLAGCALNNAGSAIKHLRHQLYPSSKGGEAYAQLFTDAASIAPGSDGLMVVPFFMPERGVPWPSTLPSMIDGLTDHHTARHRVRATLEGVAYSIAVAFRIAVPDPDAADPVRITGGLSRYPVWRQILADVLNRPLLAAPQADASALGAALLALTRVDATFDPDQFEPGDALLRIDPDPKRHAFYAQQRERFVALVDSAR